MATDGQKIVDFLKNLELESTIKLYSKEKNLHDEWEPGHAIENEGSSWVIIRGESTNHDVDQCEIVENDDEGKSLYNPDNWAIG